MAALPPAVQVAGSHLATYEGLFNQADVTKSGAIGAQDAAAYLKRSGLSEAVLSQIWEMSDPNSQGFLNKEGFFVALKLIALAQNGQELSMNSINNEVPPPTMTATPVGTPPQPSAGSAVGSPDATWVISQEEKTKYDLIFDGLLPVNGLISGDKVKPVLLNSKLPVDILSRVWDLSDVDSDGFLDREEFAVAMHLVYQALEKQPVPMQLPPNLVPPGKRKTSIPGGVPVLPGAGLPSDITPAGLASPARKASVAGVNLDQVFAFSSWPQRLLQLQALQLSQPGVTGWIVSPVEQVKYDEMFVNADLDKDGFVNGIEIKDIFLRSGVPQPVLAHIWNLCDIKGLGKLNNEQFALAMYLVQQKTNGIDPPQNLSTDLIPPSLRLRPDLPTMEAGATGSLEPSSMIELDMITKEIEDLKREKMQLEQDRAQKDADVKIRSGEMAALQKELDAINATLKQLENQKGEAQKRLDDLDDKKSKLLNAVEELKEKCQEEQGTIENLRSELSNQEVTVKNQEEELTRMRDELTTLRQEEAELEQKVEAARNQVDQLARTLNETQNHITTSKVKIGNLKDTQNVMATSISQYDALINGEEGAVEPAITSIATIQDIDLISARATAGSSPISTVSGWSANQSMDEPNNKEDPFKGKDPFAGTNGETADPFAQEDPFQSTAPAEDPFKGSDPFSQDSAFNADPFGGSDPFTDPFAGGSSGGAAGAKDAFGSSVGGGGDAFGSSGFADFGGNKEPAKPEDPFEAAFSNPGVRLGAKNDPFDPFGGGGGGSSSSFGVKSPVNQADPFGTDPFAPTTTKPSSRGKSPAPPRPGPSPTPTLPPKQKKAPPPRPPAPDDARSRGRKDVVSPSVDGSSDPFAGSDPFSSQGGTSGSAAFANFADWSPSKFSAPVEPVAPKAGDFDELAWAKQESQRAEWERRDRLRKQEEDDLKLAIELSKASLSSSEA